MFFEFLVSAIALAISAATVGTWLILIFRWKRKALRYILLPIAALGTWFCVAYWTHDPDEEPGAKAWLGHYALDSCHSVRALPSGWNGPMLFIEQGQVCRVKDKPGDRTVLVGEWHYVISDDRPYVELTFPGLAPVKVFGDPGDTRTIGTFPITGCRDH